MNPVVEAWINSYSTTRLWVNGLAKNTVEGYVGAFYNFCRNSLESDQQLCGKDPDQLVAWQENATGRERFRILSCAQVWVQKQNLRYASKLHHLSAIRSFFEHNHVQLPMDRTFHFKTEKSSVSGQLTVEDFRKILYACKPMWRALFLAIFQAGLDREGIVYVNNYLSDYIANEITKGATRIRLVLPGRKKRRNIEPFPTMIGRDAIEAIKQVLNIYFRHKVLFVNQWGKPVTKGDVGTHFHSQCIKARVLKPKPYPCRSCGADAYPVRRPWRKGVRRIFYECEKCGMLNLASDYGRTRQEKCSVRYEFGVHELRDLFRTEWHRAGGDLAVCEIMLGHGSRAVDPNKYDKICNDGAFLEEQYRTVEPYLNLLSEEPRKLLRSHVNSELKARDDQIMELRGKIGELEKSLSDSDEVLKIFKRPDMLALIKKLQRKRNAV